MELSTESLRETVDSIPSPESKKKCQNYLDQIIEIRERRVDGRVVGEAGNTQATSAEGG